MDNFDWSTIDTVLRYLRYVVTYAVVICLVSVLKRYPKSSNKKVTLLWIIGCSLIILWNLPPLLSGILVVLKPIYDFLHPIYYPEPITKYFHYYNLGFIIILSIIFVTAIIMEKKGRRKRKTKQNNEDGSVD